MSGQTFPSDRSNFPEHLEIPPEVVAIARRLEEAGHETWCVGGAVRDRLIGIPNNDVDLATAAKPEEMQALFRRTVPIGIAHGTIAVLDRHNVAHEVTTFRQDVRTDGRHAEVVFGVSLEEDLARRDFTINAIAYHPVRHDWFDPHEGVRDLANALIRAVGDPERRFREDYLRILRCIRFATRFGFQVDAATWQAACACRDGMTRLSAERVRDEWFKSITHARSVVELSRMWAEVGADGLWLDGIRLENTEVKRKAQALDRVAVRDPVFATAYLSEQPALTLERLRCSTVEIARGRHLATHRNQWPQIEDPVSVRKWMSRVGAALNDMMLLAELEGIGEGLGSSVQAIVASGAPLRPSDLAINGADLIRVGVPEGPKVGVLLRHLLDEVLEDPSRNRRDILLRMVMEDGQSLR